MVKKQTLAALLILMSLIAPAFGLGLGDINVRSNLNEPLDAEIRLIQLQGLTSGEVLPTLASNDDFRRAGIDRNFFLANIQFRVQENEAGQLVVALSTRQAVREPFLNFLVEVNWPGGRLLKEYTILLDPPVFDSDLSVDALVVESITSSPSQPSEIATSTVVEGQQTQQAAPAAQPVQPRVENLTANEYRVQRNDTLWEIALMVPGRAGYSPQQVMLAIQDLNPDAFLNNNINRLKAGSLLTLPDAAQIATRSLEVAISEVQAQNRGAAPNLRAPVTNTGEVQLSATESTASALPGGEGERDPDGYLELSADSESATTTASGEAGASVDQLQSQLAAAEELNDQFARERDELESRVTELQAQIAIMERMINVQNSDMAEVQEALSQTNEAASTEADVATETADAGAAQTPAEEVTTVAPPVASQPATEPAEPAPTPAPIVAPPPVAEPGFMGFVTEMSRKASDWVMASITNMAITGGALLLLLLLPIYIRSKRSNSNKTLSELTESSEDFEDVSEFEPEFDEDLLASSENDDEDDFLADDEPEALDAVVEAEMYMAYQKYDQAEEKLKEAFAEHPDRMDVGLKLLEVYAETGDTNAFSELESRLALTPDQKETAMGLKAKLPLVGAAALDSLDDGFNDDEISLDDDLGLDLDDDNNLSNEELGAALDLSDDKDSDDDLDFNLDLDSPLAAEDTSTTELDDTEDELSSDLDFTLDLDDVKTDSDSEEDSIELSLDDLEDDFNLDDSEESESASKDLDFSLDMEEDGVVLATDEDEDALSFDLSDEAEKTDDTSPSDLDFGELELEADDSLDLDDGEDLDFSMPSSEPEPESVALKEETDTGLPEIDDSDDAIELDLEDDALEIDDLETDVEVSDESSDPLQDLADSLDSDAELEDDEFDFLSGSDEASTKLDLARAYIEMDDKEGARDILEEVLTEGSEDQKAQAQDLISKL